MKIFITLSLIIVLVFSFNNQLSYCQQYSPLPSILPHTIDDIMKNGINVIITIDTFTQNWGVKIKDIEDVAEIAVKSSGWEFNPLSEMAIIVTIDSLMKKNDSVLVLKIKSGKNKRTIEMRKEHTPLLLSTLEQLISQTARQARYEILREYFGKPDPDYIPPLNNPQVFHELHEN